MDDVETRLAALEAKVDYLVTTLNEVRQFTKAATTVIHDVSERIKPVLEGGLLSLLRKRD